MASVPPKLSIAMVTHDMVPSLFMYDLSLMVAFTMANMPPEVPLGINMVSGTYVHSGRQELLESLIAQEATHILWVDTDMRFPRDAFLRLLNHNKPIVGINYVKREFPTSFTAIKRVGMGEEAENLQTTQASTGLEEVEAVGMGMVLMRADALQNLPETGPWFWYEWIEEGREQIGEDVYFCRLLRESGQTIWVDHDLSKECRHIGQLEYAPQHTDAFTMERKLEVVRG